MPCLLLCLTLALAPVTGQASTADMAAAQVWSTLLGGQQSEKGLSIVVDSAGNLLVTGRTRSADFPTTPGCYDDTLAGQNDVFVAKLDPSGTTLIWGTYVGGTGDDVIPTITVDADDNPVLAGTTTSSDFPVTAGAYDTTSNGARDGWIFKLDATGSTLLWSTYWGGSGNEVINRVLIDADGCPVVVGYTQSTDLTTTDGAHATQSAGNWDAYLGRFAPDGSQLLAATYLGGAGDDIGNGLTLTADGHAIITGQAGATGFPTTPGAWAPTPSGGTDTFVSKVDLTDATLIWSTLIGGSGDDLGVNVVLDAAGRAVVTGSTASADFPATAGAFDPVYNGGRDAFISVVSPGGDILRWSTFLGGSGVDKGWALAVEPSGTVVVIGATSSPDLPTGPTTFDPSYNGSDDAFIASLGNDGASLGFCTYLGGTERDEAYATAWNDDGDLLVIGMTESPTFPTTAGAYQETPSGGAEAFIVAFDLSLMGPTGVVPVTPPASLRSIHPNPFNPATTIAFSLARDGDVCLDIHAVDGRRLRRLIDTTLPGGDHTVRWDGRDDAGLGMPSGQYFARLTTDAGAQVRKMALVR